MDNEYISIEEALKLTGKHYTTIYKIKTQDELKTAKVETQDGLSQIKTAIEEVLEAKQSQLMKPIEEQALYRLGRVEQENSFLKVRLETVLQENEFLREQVKALPDKEKNWENIIEEFRKLGGIHQEEITKLKEEHSKQEKLIRQETEEKLKQLEDAHRKKLEAWQKEQNELHREDALKAEN